MFVEMKNARDALKKGRVIIKNAGIESYAFDSRHIFEYVTGVKRTDIIGDFNLAIPRDKARLYLELCKKRAKGYPLQYIVGSWEFMGLEFEVNENVLIPRADTETLVNYVLMWHKDCKLLDMCTGSGCIGISIKHYMDTADVTLADISKNALDTAKRNAESNGTNVKFVEADLTKGFALYFEKESFDVIVANPPYIKTADMDTLEKEVKHEPHLALCGGDDGLDYYRSLITDWKQALRDGGVMALETGYDTWQGVIKLFEQNGYKDINKIVDYSGVARVITAIK